MDSPELSDRAKRGLHFIFLRCSFSLLALFFLSLVAVLVGNFSIPGPIIVPTECKIVWSSVDLRSSKVCELGLLNYKAKHVFYPLERKKFRCRYDYYWASVFKVEYIEHSSGHTRHALAEAPNEALPLDCRPNFGTAWLTKDTFKVNKTYDCWYTPGITNVNIYHHSFFNCQAKDPSIIEIIRRCFILSMRIINSWFASRGRAKYLRWETVSGIIAGVLTSLISISLVKLLQGMKSRLSHIWEAKTLHLAVFTVRFKRACFLVAYVSVMGWLTIQYGKMLSLPEIFNIL